MTEVQITAELLDELDSKATAATPQRLDSAEHVIAADPNAMIECPICHGEGYASLENDYCNFDNHAIGVQFYGIGPSFGLAEEYFRAANPATILALTAHIRSLTEQLAAANEKIDKAWNQPYSSTLDLEGYIPGALDAWKRPVKQRLPYDFSGNPEASAIQYCNGWNDAGGYWKSHVISLTERLEKAEKDAGRYQWLRKVGEQQLNAAMHNGLQELDRFVDAASAQEADHE